MTSVASAIASLLYDRDTVIVPGLGAFVRYDRSAHVNVITNEFQRPSSQLSFDARRREENNLIGEYLMASDGLTNDEARTAIATFVSECFACLKEEGQVTLPGLGTLTMDEQQDLAFEPVENNFNGDAFGLEDLWVEPVYGTGSGVPMSPPTPDENTPLDTDRSEPENPPSLQTEVPSQDVRDPHGEPRPLHRTWWIGLLLLLLVAAGVALWYFRFRPVPTMPWPSRPVPAMHPRERMLPQPEMPEALETPDTLETPEPPKPIEIPDTEPTTKVTPEPIPTASQTSASIEVVQPEPTSKAFIVGGCFEVEKYALNMTTEAREQGCTEAFVMKRGTKYFVCYGQYPSTADAKDALPEVLANYNAKAWILTK